MGPGLLTVAPSAPGAGFSRIDGALYCDGVRAAELATAVGTPAFVYSAPLVRAAYARLDGALAGVRHRLHYSMKANGNLAVLSLLRGLGAGVDIVSGGELFRARTAGYDGGDIVFSGVGKSHDELRDAVAAGVKLVNVESAGELDLLSRIASEAGRCAAVALRVNPEVTVDTPHPYTRTGGKGHKFGIPYDEVVHLARRALTLPGVRLAGLDMHIGSQITSLAPFEDAFRKLAALVADLRQTGAADLRYLDVGGGLAVSYDDEPGTDVEAFGRLVQAVLAPTALEVLVEPGRYLVGNAGLLLTRVLYCKRSGGKLYVVTDAGMTELLRPSHYDAFHHIEAAEPISGQITADVVGPVCESGDFLALDRALPAVKPGDLLAVWSAGAYGFVMSSNYNARPRSPEVLVDGGRFAVARERERYEDLIRHERVHPEWRQA